jgi:hypothetical protein
MSATKFTTTAVATNLNTDKLATETALGVKGYSTPATLATYASSNLTANTVVAAKLALTAQYRLIGRSSASAGGGEEIACSANVFTMLGSATNAAILSNIGASAFIGSTRILFQLIGANMNIDTDQQFTKVGTFTNYITLNVKATNASAIASTAVGGIYSAASKAGISLISASTGYTALTTAGEGQGIGASNNAGGGVLTTTPYLSLTTPQGSAATADFYIIGEALT